MERTVDTESRPHGGLRGRELVEWALEEGESCVEELGKGSTEIRYFKAVARTAGKSFPPGFFASTIEELMDNR